MASAVARSPRLRAMSPRSVSENVMSYAKGALPGSARARPRRARGPPDSALRLSSSCPSLRRMAPSRLSARAWSRATSSSRGFRGGQRLVRRIAFSYSDLAPALVAGHATSVAEIQVTRRDRRRDSRARRSARVRAAPGHRGAALGRRSDARSVARNVERRAQVVVGAGHGVQRRPDLGDRARAPLRRAAPRPRSCASRRPDHPRCR